LHTDVDTLINFIRRRPQGSDDVYERALNEIAKEKGNVRNVSYRGDWTAIKYPWHILDATGFFLDKSRSRISSGAFISPWATVEGKVIIEAGAKILENAVIRGPVYIGKNTVIGNNCLVRQYSHIGDNCTIGFGTEIKSSYMGHDCRTHMNYIGDSVIGDNCSLGAGTITANWRLDEKNVRVKIGTDLIDTGRNKFGAVIGNNCRTGIHVSIMPGIKIGPNISIEPGTIVKRNIISGQKD
jgi:NDP-sugar pyrophosphorylase family protein